MKVPARSFIASRGPIGETLKFLASGEHYCRTPWGLRKIDPAIAQAHEYRVMKAKVITQAKLVFVAGIAVCVGTLLGASLL